MRTVSVSDRDELQALAKQLVKSKRVAFIVGAGISTASGIPDFRSASTGLFASLKERNPDVKLASGKDLFHTNLFQREDTTRAFYMMIAELKRLADEAPPTEFHLLMKQLEDANKLFRIYTQNIDALEAKAGLSYGLGEWKETVRSTSSPKKGKGKAKASAGGSNSTPSSPSKKKQSAKMGKAASVRDEPSRSITPASHPATTINDRQGQSISEPFASTSQYVPPSESVEVDEAYGQSDNTDILDALIKEEQERQQCHSQQQHPDFPPSSSQGPSTVIPDSFQIESRLEMPSFSQHSSTTTASTNEVAMSVNPADIFSAQPVSTIPSSQSEDYKRSSQAAAQMEAESMQAATFALQDLHVEEDLPPPSSQVDSSLPPSSQPFPPSSQQSTISNEESEPSASQPTKAASSKGSNVRRFLTVPKVIPLHGTLETMHCPKCTHSESISTHLDTLATGYTIHCPVCLTADQSRNALGERSRGVGVLKVSVVLYGEEHAQAGRVGEIAEKDLLKAARPDFLIVAGTTLKIPGVKKLVKELGKVIRMTKEKPSATSTGTTTPAEPVEADKVKVEGEGEGEEAKVQPESLEVPAGSQVEGQAELTVTPSSQPETAVTPFQQQQQQQQQAPKVIYVNFEPPTPETTWRDVFDTFVQGDVQVFANMVRQELEFAMKKIVTIPSIPKQITLDAAQFAVPAVPAKKPKAINADVKPAVPVPKAKQPKAASRTVKKAEPTIKQKQTLLPFTKVKGKAVKGQLAKQKKQTSRSRSPKKASVPLPVTEKPVKQPKPPKEPKEKTKPGWKGYAIAIGEVEPPKHNDHWATTVDGPRRRKPVTQMPPLLSQSSSAAPALTQEPASSQPEPSLQSVDLPVDTATLMQALLTSTPPGPKVEAFMNALNASLSKGESPSRASTLASSLLASNAPTPPSLASDVSTVSETDETSSIKGDMFENQATKPDSHSTVEIVDSAASSQPTSLTSLVDMSVSKEPPFSNPSLPAAEVEDSQPPAYTLNALPCDSESELSEVSIDTEPGSMLSEDVRLLKRTLPSFMTRSESSSASSSASDTEQVSDWEKSRGSARKRAKRAPASLAGKITQQAKVVKPKAKAVPAKGARTRPVRGQGLSPAQSNLV